MKRWKSRGAKNQRRETKKEDPRRERARRRSMQVREKVEKLQNIVIVFPMFCSSRGSESRLAEAAGAEPSGQVRDQKLHAVVARSRFRSQNELKDAKRSKSISA